MTLSAGDLVTFPHGNGHRMGGGAPVTPIDGETALPGVLARGLDLLRGGGGGACARFICGFLACDPQLSQAFLGGLPRVIKVNVRGEPGEPSGQWLENSLMFSVAQASSREPGASAMLAKLSEVGVCRDASAIRARAARRADRVAGGRTRPRGWPGAHAASPAARASMDARRAGARVRPVTHRARGALPALPRRVADGLSDAVATAVGRARARHDHATAWPRLRRRSAMSRKRPSIAPSSASTAPAGAVPAR